MNLENTLRLQRFCGHEVYAVQKAEVFLDLPREDAQGILLNLEFHSGALIECTTPDDERGDEPTIEVNLPIPSLAASELVGTTIRVKKALDQERGTWNRIYVFEHEDLREIAATFMEISEDECRVSLTARTQDPNHYDGSKPETIVKLEGWFPLAKFHEAAKSVAPPASVKPASVRPASVKPASIPPAAANPTATKAVSKKTAPKQTQPKPATETAAVKTVAKAAPQQSAPKAPAKKAPAEKAPAKKAPAKKAPAKKPPAKKAPAKKAPAKKAPAKKAPAKKAPGKKAPAKKPPAKKPPAKKAPAKKPPAKKAARKA